MAWILMMVSRVYIYHQTQVLYTLNIYSSPYVQLYLNKEVHNFSPHSDHEQN